MSKESLSKENLRHGAFSWVELMTSDQGAARDFYSRLFGWETEEYPMQDANYTVLKVDGVPVGGIMTTPPECQGMTPSWSAYVTVDDVDATADQVTELGGKLLHPPTDIPEIGRFCVLQDPQGAVICAITYLVKE
ncbi:VOC family protein [Desulfogranum mediterraneum]|uniref:VOC family protein n=1 Tax=Desulfogranum mediterraneum TaxID=160661 RepID=UPI0004137113|nr:VOC family protein [Desulfogranum mediterraneum]